MTFARESRRLMDGLLAEYRTLSAWVWLGHHVTIRWLEWLGFARGPSDGTFAWYTKERN